MPGIIGLGANNQKACVLFSGTAPIIDPKSGVEVGTQVIAGNCLGEGCTFFVISKKVCLFWHMYNVLVEIGNMLESIEKKSIKEIPVDLKE